MRGALSCSALSLFLAFICKGARVDPELPVWDHAASFDNFINRITQARALVGRATDTHQRWLTVRDLMGETSQAAAEGEVALQELGETFAYINHEIEDNNLETLLDEDLTVGDLRGLANGDALVRISQEFISTSEQLVTISNLLEVIVETMVAVVDLTESVPELAGAWSGFDTQHMRGLTARVSAVSERFSQEADNLHTVNEQLSPLEGWDEMGRWRRAGVISLNYRQLRAGMRGLRQSKNSLEEYYNGEAVSAMADVVSTVQSMTSTVNRFSGR